MLPELFAKGSTMSSWADNGFCSEKLRYSYRPELACRYSRKHGYGFKCEVLTKEDMLAAISPRDAFTWYKAAQNNK